MLEQPGRGLAGLDGRQEGLRAFLSACQVRGEGVLEPRRRGGQGLDNGGASLAAFLVGQEHRRILAELARESLVAEHPGQ